MLGRQFYEPKDYFLYFSEVYFNNLDITWLFCSILAQVCKLFRVAFYFRLCFQNVISLPHNCLPTQKFSNIYRTKHNLKMCYSFCSTHSSSSLFSSYVPIYFVYLLLFYTFTLICMINKEKSTNPCFFFSLENQGGKPRWNNCYLMPSKHLYVQISGVKKYC